MTYRPTNHRLRCRRAGKPNRRGATAIELAIVVMIFLTLVLGMLDLGIGVFRYNLLSQAVRQGTRQAIVHGGMADRLGPWGTATYSGTADDGSPIALAMQPSLVGLDPAQVTILAEWPDGGNEVSEHDRVRVTVSAPYQPIMTFIFGNPTFTLQASSTMAIAH
jgi:hypothetical protein